MIYAKIFHPDENAMRRTGAVMHHDRVRLAVSPLTAGYSDLVLGGLLRPVVGPDSAVLQEGDVVVGFATGQEDEDDYAAAWFLVGPGLTNRHGLPSADDMPELDERTLAALRKAALHVETLGQWSVLYVVGALASQNGGRTNSDAIENFLGMRRGSLDMEIA